MKCGVRMAGICKMVIIATSILEIAFSLHSPILSKALKRNHLDHNFLCSDVRTVARQKMHLHRHDHRSYAVPLSKGTERRSFFSPIYRKLNWLRTFVSHIIQLIMKTIENFEKGDKRRGDNGKQRTAVNVERSIPSEMTMQTGAKKEDSQRASVPQPKPIALYGNNERNEADKSYAERKLQEIENLQIEAQNARLARKAKAERDEQWAQATMDNTDKKEIKSRSYSEDTESQDDDGDGEENNASSALNEKTRGSISSDGGDRKNFVNADGASRAVDKDSRDALVRRSFNQKDAPSQKRILKQDTDGLNNGRKISEDIADEGDMYLGEKITDESKEASSKFSTKPNLNVILKKSLKDSLYSINVDGFYSNNGSSVVTEMQGSSMNPLVRNSLLLSEQVELQRKLDASKLGVDSFGVSSADDVTDYGASPSLDDESNEDLRKYTEEELQLLQMVDDGLSENSVETESVTTGEVPTLDNSEYLLPPAFLSEDESETELPSVGEDAFYGVVDGPIDGGPVILSTMTARGVDGNSLWMADRKGLSAAELDGIPDYSEDSIERSVQRQQAAEYNGDFSDTPLYSALPSFPESSSSNSFPFSSTEDYPGTVPLCLLGDWELAEQRYLSPDRSLLSDPFLDKISVPSFGSLSSSISGSKGMDWAAKRREVVADGDSHEQRTGDSESSSWPSSEARTGAVRKAFEEYDVEFNLIRGCSSTEWMRGEGKFEKTMTARIIKPPKNASEQRPTLCIYTGVLLSPVSIKGFVFSKTMTVEGEQQLVGRFEMNKII